MRARVAKHSILSGTVLRNQELRSLSGHHPEGETVNWTVEADKVWKGQRERARLLLSLMLGLRVTGSPQFARGARSVHDAKFPDF